MKIILTILLFLASLFAQNEQLIIDNSYSFIEYGGSHFLHKWIGKSHLINGTILIDNKNPINSKVNISIPIFSFDSENGNRDSNMLLVVEDFLYPDVRFISTSISQVGETEYKVKGNLNFHGLEKEITFPVEVNYESDYTYFISSFSLNLKDFNIKRPKLMLAPISEIIEIRLQLRGSF